MGEAAAVASLVLFSGNAFVVRAATRRLDQQPGFLVAILLIVLVMALLATATWASGFGPTTVDGPAVVLIAVSGGLRLWALGGTLTVLGQFGLVVAVGDIPVGVAVAIASATPALVRPASYLLLADRGDLGVPTVAGAALVLVGVVLLLVLPGA